MRKEMTRTPAALTLWPPVEGPGVTATGACCWAVGGGGGGGTDSLGPETVVIGFDSGIIGSLGGGATTMGLIGDSGSTRTIGWGGASLTMTGAGGSSPLKSIL